LGAVERQRDRRFGGMGRARRGRSRRARGGSMMQIRRPLLWLALSVGLNLLLGGVLVGSLLAGPHREKVLWKIDGSPRHGPGARRIVSEALGPDREEFRELRKSVAAARAKARAALER